MEELHSRVCARISLSAVEENFRLMKGNLKEGVKLCAVIKTDAYGHGAVPIARLVEDYDYVWGFAVATPQEAIQLKEAGIHKPVLILGCVFEEDFPALIQYEIRPALFTLEMARKLSSIAVKEHTRLPVHLALDTGMSRIGLECSEEGVSLAGEICALPGIIPEGLFTHFARADEKDKQIARQALDQYNWFAGRLKELGISVQIRHCSNSAGILEIPEAHLDMVRAGITIYGIYPSDEMDREKNVLHPVMELKSHIAYLKTVPSGTPVSYGGTYVTSRETRIATIPVGYGDGYPRSLSNKGYVLIRGKKAPILGRVCMDQFMVDVTDIEADEHEEVTLMGMDHGEMLSVDTLGELSGRFPYEFVCDIGSRVPRVYIS